MPRMTRARVWKPHHRFVRIMQGTDNQHNKKESEEHRLRFDASTRRHANQAMFPTAQLVWRVRVRDLHDGARVGASRGRTVRPRRRLGVMGFRIFAAAALRDAAERRPARHLNAPAAAVAEAWTTERLSRLGPDISSPPLVFMVRGEAARGALRSLPQHFPAWCGEATGCLAGLLGTSAAWLLATDDACGSASLLPCGYGPTDPSCSFWTTEHYANYFWKQMANAR